MWPLGVYFALVLLLVAGMLVVSYLLGQRHHQRSTGEPYEGGILSEGSARVRLSAKFYLVAMFFVIFDLEAVFLFAWAVTARSLGWPAFWEAVIFVGVLAAALLYLWRVGALDWSSSSKQKEGANAVVHYQTRHSSGRVEEGTEYVRRCGPPQRSPVASAGCCVLGAKEFDLAVQFRPFLLLCRDGNQHHEQI